jgi:micrococcal nuclease
LADVAAADGDRVLRLLCSLNPTLDRTNRRRRTRSGPVGGADFAPGDPVAEAESVVARARASVGRRLPRWTARGHAPVAADGVADPVPALPPPPLAQAWPWDPDEPLTAPLAAVPGAVGRRAGRRLAPVEHPTVPGRAVPGLEDVAPAEAQPDTPAPERSGRHASAADHARAGEDAQAGDERRLAQEQPAPPADAAQPSTAGPDGAAGGAIPAAGTLTSRAARGGRHSAEANRSPSVRWWVGNRPRVAVAAGLLGAAALGSVLLLGGHDNQLTPEPVALDLRVGPTTTVTRVFDGGTVELAGAYGGKVAIGGIAVPSAAQGQCGADAAAQFALRTLQGKVVTLVTDPTQPQANKAGVRQGDLRLPDGSYYSIVAARAGVVHYYQNSPPGQLAGQISAAEAQAEQDKVGLWGPPCTPG